MSDLISRKVVIEDIEDLLKSPYAHSQFGEASKEVGFAIRKEMAEIIIDLCVKRAETSYDIDRVVEKLEKFEFETTEEPHAINLYRAIEIVEGGGVDE